MRNINSTLTTRFLISKFKCYLTMSNLNLFLSRTDFVLFTSVWLILSIIFVYLMYRKGTNELIQQFVGGLMIFLLIGQIGFTAYNIVANIEYYGELLESPEQFAINLMLQFSIPFFLAVYLWICINFPMDSDISDEPPKEILDDEEPLDVWYESLLAKLNWIEDSTALKTLPESKRENIRQLIDKIESELK